MTEATVSSAQNPRVKYIRKLSRRAFRDKERAFLLEGPVVLREALHSGAPVNLVVLGPGAPGADDLRSLAETAGVPILEVDDHVMRSISGTAAPQGVVGVCSMTDISLEDLPTNLSLVLVLAGVQDPGNAGTLVRSAVAAGAEAVIFSDSSVDPYSGKTVRSSAGLVCRTQLVRQADLAEASSMLRARGLRVVGADASSTTPHDEADLRSPIAVVLGNEAAGFPEAYKAGFFDALVKIPMPGPAECLNVAAAGSILLFEAARQRRLGSRSDDEVR